MNFYSVHFNRPDFIEIQKKCLDKFEGYKLIVINNQANPEIESKCIELGIKYYNHIHPKELSSSRSHGSALNFLKGIIDPSQDWCIKDHDIFICGRIDLTNFDLVSISQIKEGKSYLWPGFIAGRAGISISDIDFSPSTGFDTGWGTYSLIESGYKINYVSEKYLGEKTTEFLQTSNVITNISNLAIHYLNGSCWMPTSEITLTEKNTFLFETLRNMGIEI